MWETLTFLIQRPPTRSLWNIDGIAWLSLVTVLNPLGAWAFGASYAAIGTVLGAWVLAFIFHHLRRGPPGEGPSAVVVTGGANGLGRALVEVIHREVSRVIIVDVEKPTFVPPNGVWVEWDLAEGKAIAAGSPVKTLASTIDAIVPITQVDTIVCCAGMRQHESLLNADPNHVAAIAAVNWTSQLHLIKTILTQRTKAKLHTNIMGVCSVLAFFAPARLGLYSGTKAAMACSLEALREETSRKFVTVATLFPGQLDTRMFADKHANAFAAPLLDAKRLAQTMAYILRARLNGDFVYPLYGRLLPAVRTFPYALQRVARAVSGIDT